MKLQAIPLGATILSSNLKVGLLAGIVGVSASTGAVATAFSSGSLSSAFEAAISPVKSFLGSHISPHFDQVFGGAKKIGGKLEEWGTDVYGRKDSTLSWIQKNFSSSTLKSGFTTILDKTKEWANSGKETLVTTYGVGKNTVLPFLSSSDQVRSLLYHGSEITNVLKALGVLLTTSAFTSVAGVAGGDGGSSSDEDEDEEDSEGATSPPLSKFWELIKSGNLGDVVSSVLDLVTNNLNVVKQLTRPDVSKIVDFVLGDSGQVKKRIEEMKKPKNDKSGKSTPSKWGKYENVNELMEALIPTPGIAEMFASIFKEILTEEEKLEDYVNESSKKFSKETVKKIFSCGESDSDCSKEMTFEELLTKLLSESVTSQQPSKDN